MRYEQELGGENGNYSETGGSARSESVGELLCAVNNDKLELLPNNQRKCAHQFAGTDRVLSCRAAAVEAEGGRRFVFVVRRATGRRQVTLEKREIHVGIADANKTTRS